MEVIKLDVIDYLDEDVAYLLGLLTGRGTISESNGATIMIIEFPYSYIQTDDISEKDKLIGSLNKIRNRIKEMTEASVDIEEGNSYASIKITFQRRDVLLRDIEYLFEGRRSYKDFLIPRQIFGTTTEIKKEYIKGFADVSGKVRRSNAYMGGIHRVYLDVLNDNWHLPVMICELLQLHLNIPVQTITWGHPNLRNKPTERWTKREHQIKVFAEDFESIGFYLTHKQKALSQLAAENRNKDHHSKMCNPVGKKISGKNPTHPDENNPDLPDEIRGKHYNAYWQICRDLGCYRWRTQRLIDGDDE